MLELLKLISWLHFAVEKPPHLHHPEKFAKLLNVFKVENLTVVKCMIHIFFEKSLIQVATVCGILI